MILEMQYGGKNRTYDAPRLELHDQNGYPRIEVTGEDIPDEVERAAARDPEETTLEAEEKYWRLRRVKPWRVRQYPAVMDIPADGPPTHLAFILAGAGLSGKTTVNRRGILKLDPKWAPSGGGVLNARKLEGMGFQTFVPPSIAKIGAERPWLLDGARMQQPIEGGAQLAVEIGQEFVDFPICDRPATYDDIRYIFRHMLPHRHLMWEFNLAVKQFNEVFKDTDLLNRVVLIRFPDLSPDEVRRRVNKRIRNPAKTEQQINLVLGHYRHSMVLNATAPRMHRLSLCQDDDGWETHLREIREIVKMELARG